MIFAKKNDYGVTEDVFLNRQHISYANLCEVKTPLGLTIGNATAIDKRKQICLKKCFSEYLERFDTMIQQERQLDIYRKQ